MIGIGSELLRGQRLLEVAKQRLEQRFARVVVVVDHRAADERVASFDGHGWIDTGFPQTELGEEFTVECDTVVAAISQEPDFTGLDEIGNPKDWSGRSELWGAVLVEHAKTGYLEMPGKGGHEDLSEDAVEAAAEYLLNVTFPEKPRD